MTRRFVTKRIAHLLCIAVSLSLLRAIPDDLPGRFELPVLAAPA